MKIDFRTEQGCSLISISGEVDAASALTLDDTIGQAIRQQKGNILLNCLGLQYMSSAGLGVLISYLKQLDDQDRKLILFEVSEPMMNVFSILGLDSLLVMTNSQEEALSLCA